MPPKPFNFPTADLGGLTAQPNAARGLRRSGPLQQRVSWHWLAVPKLRGDTATRLAGRLSVVSVFVQTSLLISSSSVQTELAWKAFLPGGMGQACFGENHGPPAHSPAAGGVQRMCWGGVWWGVGSAGQGCWLVPAGVSAVGEGKNLPKMHPPAPKSTPSSNSAPTLAKNEPVSASPNKHFQERKTVWQELLF